VSSPGWTGRCTPRDFERFVARGRLAAAAAAPGRRKLRGTVLAVAASPARVASAARVAAAAGAGKAQGAVEEAPVPSCGVELALTESTRPAGAAG